MKINTKLFEIILILIVLILPVKSKSQIITFEFNGLAGNEATAVSNSNNSNLSQSTISRGSGLTASTNGNRFNATNWAVTSIANAISGNNYMEFSITPNSGYAFSVSSIIFNIQRSSTGLTQIALRNSIDNYTTSLDAVKSITDITSTQIITFTFSQSNSSSSVTYRLYGYSEAAGGSGGFEGTGNDIIVNGSVTAIPTPTISSPSPTSLSGFSTTTGAASSSQSFTIGGSDLTANLVVTAPTDYEVSTDNASFGASVSLTPSSGTVSSTTIYVRIKSTASVGSPSGNVVCSSTGATNQNVAISGAVVSGSSPILTVSTTTISGFTTASGTASSSQSFTLEGDNLTAQAVVTAPTNFEVSTDNSNFSSSLNISQSGGNLVGEPVTIYTRVATSASAGAVSGSLSITSTGATTKSISLSGQVIAAQPTTSSSSVGFTSISCSGFTLNWINGNGSNRIVLVKASSAVDATPADGTTYAANAAFGSGDQLGTGNYVAYNGTGSSVSITNITGGLTYHISIFEYNGTTTTINYSATGTAASSATPSSTQFEISTAGTAVTIDFDNSVCGVNEGIFLGTGLVPSPTSGQLNSNAIRITGLSDNPTFAFGDSRTSGDFARGAASGTPGGTGGIWAWDVDASAAVNRILGFRPSASDLTPGDITLKYFNTTGNTVTSFLITYTIYVFNDQGRGFFINPSYSLDDASYTDITAENYTSDATASGSASWQTITKSILIDNISVADAAAIYFKWSLDDATGSGSRDALGLDDISITLNPTLTNYYYSGNGSLSSTSNWGTNTDGTGTAPASFSSTLSQFYLQNVTNVSTSGSLTIDGAGSKLIVGDGTSSTILTITNSFPIDATVDVSANSQLLIQHATAPTLSSLAPTSTVTFNSGGSFDLPNTTYGNIVFDNCTVNNPATATDLVFKGNFTLQSNASFSCTNYNLHTSGTANQTITTNGNPLSVGYLENNNTYSKTGSLTLGSSSNITLAGRIIMNNTGAANAFIDGGNTITVGDDVYLGGDTAGYQLTGTLLLSASSGSVVVADNTSNGAAAPYFNNIILNTSGTVSATVRPFSGTGNLKIGGNLAITSTSSGAITLNDNNIYLYGDFTSTQTSDLITEDGSTLLFMKNGAQTFDVSAATNNSFNKLKIGSNSILSLSGNIALADTLVLNGQLKPTASTLTLNGFADLGANHKFSFDGNSSLAFQGASINETLNIDQTTVGTTNRLNNLTFSSTSGSLILNNALQVSGAVTLSNGTLNTSDSLTLTSDASSTGYIAEITGTGALSGKITQQRYISGIADYRELASAVYTTFADWDSTLITSGFTGSDYPSYGFNNIYSWNEGALTAIDTNAYTGISNITDSLNPGVGYSVYVYPDTGNFPITLSTSGTPVTGNFTFSVTQNGTGTYAGYNLVGNPYPCAIDWDAANWTKTNIGATFYIWDYTNQHYDAWQTGVGGTNGGSNIIPSSRAFWVKANAASPVLTVTETCKSAGQGTFYKSTTDLSIVTATLHSATQADEAKIIFNAAATSATDAGIDANKMWNYGTNALNIYTKTPTTQPLVFNHTGNLEHEAETVEVWARVATPGTYAIDFSSENLAPERIVVTPNTDTNSLPFCLAQNTNLNFTTTTSNASVLVATLELYPDIELEKNNTTCQNTSTGSIIITAGARDSIELKNNQGVSILGSKSANEISFTQLPAGIYQLISYYSGLCTTQHLQQITIAPETKIVEGITATDSIEINALFVCTANDTLCQSYVWNWGDSAQTTGAVSETHTYTTTGLKTVELEVSKNGCEIAFTKDVFVAAPNAVDELAAANSTIYLSGKTLVIAAESEEKYNVTIFSIDGRELYRNENIHGATTVDVSLLGPGNYLAQKRNVTGDSESLKFTLLKE